MVFKYLYQGEFELVDKHKKEKKQKTKKKETKFFLIFFF
jgi:hypothetical protein